MWKLRPMLQLASGVSRTLCTGNSLAAAATTTAASTSNGAQFRPLLSPPLSAPAVPVPSSTAAAWLLSAAPSSINQAPRISPLIHPVIPRILPPAVKSHVELPYLRYKEISLPQLGNVKAPVKEPTTPVGEIRCAVLIRIRRKKIKKHQRIKWRKRRRFLIAKIELRRLKTKEAAFKAELLGKLQEAKDFDAEQYIKSVLTKIRDRNAHVETPEQRRERIMELKRKYRSNVEWVKPKLDVD